jgi:hypothetical protein
LIAVLLLAALVVSCGGIGGAPPAGPHIAFEQTSRAAGSLEQGTPAKYVFAFRNDGARALRVESLRTACDCTATLVPADVVSPGQSGSIEVQCNTAALAGREHRSVTVYSNDASHPEIALSLDFDVSADIAPLVPAFYFGRARRGGRTARDIRLRLQDPRAVPRQARAEHGSFDAAIEKRTDDEWRVALTVSPQAKSGELRDWIVIETASAKQPRLVVPVVGTIETGSKVKP